MPTKTGTRKQVKGKAKANELVIERVFDAPRERVWKAWTQPEQAKRWWGPKGFTAPYWKSDFRVGGKYLYCMRSPDGMDYWGTGVYREIVPTEKIVATDSFADSEGNVVRASHYGFAADFPPELLLTVTFEDLGGKTKMTLRHAGFPAGPDREGAVQGWTESLEKLAATLSETSSGTEFVTDRARRRVTMSRVFNAPRERLFRMYTDPKLIPLWWGPRKYATTVEKMDVRPGGVWRYISRDSDGTEFAFNGVYREVAPPERLVSTFEFEGAPGHIVLDTATFEDLGRKTRLTVTSQFDSLEALEGMVGSGMEAGARETWDRLVELLAKA
ncbi:MAG: hypothetical protein E6K14_05465 [Methanobacteriota archaeon]|nr:MAG: hypothetical protein E6K14_05465 [Euryarchaeota archaeon]